MNASTAVRDPGRSVGFALAIGFFLVILCRTAWISDAAYLTFRTVEHVALGYGARWNVAERVQVYDQPLWMLLLLAGRRMTGELYFTALVISIGLSIAVATRLIAETARPVTMVLAVGAVTLSPSFLSFATSGLGSPLLHLLTLAFASETLRPSAGTRPIVLVILASLLALTEWTALLFALPALIWIASRHPWRTRASMVAGVAVPVLLWNLWAYWYYGTIGPNASLADQVSWTGRLDVGRMFLADTARLDPVLLCVIGAGLVAGLRAGGASRAVALGVLLLSSSAIVLGGSPMAGWGLTAPYAVSILVIARCVTFVPALAGLTAAAGLAALALGAPISPLTGSDFGLDAKVAGRTHDARRLEYQSTALLLESRGRRAPAHPEASRAAQLLASNGRVAMSPMPGTFGIAAGPSVHVIDPAGRTDPLLARLPPAVGTEWRWGAKRRLPDGYLEHLENESVPLQEVPLADLDRAIRKVTRAPLDERGRTRAVRALPAIASDRIAPSSYGASPIPYQVLAASAQPYAIGEGGLLVSFAAPETATGLRASISARHDYHVEIFQDSTRRFKVTVPLKTWNDEPDRTATFDFSGSKTLSGLRITCGAGAGPCAIGDVSLVH